MVIATEFQGQIFPVQLTQSFTLAAEPSVALALAATTVAAPAEAAPAEAAVAVAAPAVAAPAVAAPAVALALAAALAGEFFRVLFFDPSGRPRFLNRGY